MINTIIKEGKANRVINIKYRDSKNVITVRDVEPYEIRDNALFAYCLSKNNMRKFNLDNIIEVNLTGKQFSPQWEIQL